MTPVSMMIADDANATGFADTSHERWACVAKKLKSPSVSSATASPTAASTAAPSEDSATCLSVAVSPAGSFASAISSASALQTSQAAWQSGSTCRDMSLASQLVAAIERHASASPPTLSSPKSKLPYNSTDATRLVSKCLRLLRSCKYEWEDVELILAHALVYLGGMEARLRKDMRPTLQLKEAVYSFCLLVFMAHAYIEDLNCPLHVWHRYLFRNYCSLPVLNNAVMSLMEKLGFVLRVQSDDLEAMQAFLRQCDA